MLTLFNPLVIIDNKMNVDQWLSQRAEHPVNDENCEMLDSLQQGSYPFLNKKFKDFQGHISHISRTLFNSKRALILCLFLVLPQRR